MPRNIIIPRTVLNAVEEHAEDMYPEECCGFIFGKSRIESIVVDEVHRVQNHRDENRTRRFLITPEQFMRAEEFADSEEKKLLGVYHSHPDHPATPSRYDLDHALPDFVYLITSVEKGKAKICRWWELTSDRCFFSETEVAIVTT
ncbi:MAG: M67 family metallopeptidase [candidate division Zixibacteria bacterium]|nr:M67 family metallopeptidase [candidate division Zixibacteria bacterium]